MLKKHIAVLLFSLVLMLSLLVPSSAQQSFSLMGYEPAENARTWQDNLFFQRREEATGISLTFSQYDNRAGYHEALIKLSKDDPGMPDALMKADLSNSQANEMYKKGVLIDLAPYLQNMPALSALMQEFPEIRQAITQKDGSILTLPYVSMLPSQNILWINQAWLTTLKLDLPKNREEFLQVLSAFAQKDPNRNNRKDEVPLSFLGPYDLKYLAHAFGLVANDFNLYAKENKAAFLPFDESYYDFLTWLVEMYQQGLLDKDGFVTADAFRRQTDANAASRYGAFFALLPTQVVPVEKASDYVALPPLSESGTGVYRAVASPVFPGAFAVTTACEDVGSLLSWVDFLYTQEGSILASVGKEGEDYVFDGDGSWRLLRDMGNQLQSAKATLSTDHMAPGISSDLFQTKFSDASVRKLYEQLKTYQEAATLPFPAIPLTQEEETKIASMQAVLGKAVDEALARFVLGEVALNEETYQAHLEEMKVLQLQEFLDLWQGIINRGKADDGN